MFYTSVSIFFFFIPCQGKDYYYCLNLVNYLVDNKHEELYKHTIKKGQNP